MLENLRRMTTYAKKRPGQVATAAVFIASSAFYSACLDQRPPVNSTPILPVANGSPAPESSTKYLSWLARPAIERIRMLEINSPDIQDLNLNTMKELTLSTAQYFHEKVKPDMTAQEMADRIYLLDADRFIAEYKKTKQKELNPEEKKEFGSETDFEIQQGDKRVIYINTQVITRAVEISNAAAKKANLDIKQGMGGRDLTTVITKDSLLRAYFLMNRSKEINQFSPVPIRINNKKNNEIFYVMGIDQLFLQVRTAKGVNFESTGGLRSIIECLVEPLSRETGSYFPFNPSHINGADLIKAVNQLSGVSIEKTTDVLLGRKTLEELLKSWGIESKSSLPDVIAGQRIYSVIDFAGAGYLSLQEAGVKIDELLNTSSTSLSKQNILVNQTQKS